MPMTPDGQVAGDPQTRWAMEDFQEPPRDEGGVVLCGACRTTGICKLGVRREGLEDTDTAVFTLACPAEYEGGPNVAHGGWTAAAFDDCMGHLPLLHRVRSVTAEITVGFLKPVPVGRDLELRARVERREGRRWYITAEMTLLTTGAVLARASGVWVTRDAAHFDRHEQWLAQQDASAAKWSAD